MRLFPLALGLLAGCASPRPEAFRGLDQSVAQAQTGLESEMDRDVIWTREADVQITAAGPALGDHLLKNTDGGAWTLEARPAFWDARATRRALGAMNEAFRGYTGLLAGVASGEIADAAAVEDAAQSVNRDLRALADARDRPGLKREAAEVSVVVTEGFHRFLHRRRAAALAEALRQNQPLVDGYAAHCAALIGLIRADLKTAYADQAAALCGKWDDKRSPGRISLTRTLFNLNEEYADALERLERLARFYDALPAAHRSLIDGVTGRRPAAVASLGREAARLARLTRDLEKAR